MKNIFQRLFGEIEQTVAKTTTNSQKTKAHVSEPTEYVIVNGKSDLLEGTYRFFAVDVETANRQQSSICQCGLALAAEDGCRKAIGFLIDPEQSFKNVNIDLHGIDEAAVRDAPTF